MTLNSNFPFTNTMHMPLVLQPKNHKPYNCTWRQQIENAKASTGIWKHFSVWKWLLIQKDKSKNDECQAHISSDKFSNKWPSPLTHCTCVNFIILFTIIFFCTYWCTICIDIFFQNSFRMVWSCNSCCFWFCDVGYQATAGGIAVCRGTCCRLRKKGLRRKWAWY